MVRVRGCMISWVSDVVGGSSVFHGLIEFWLGSIRLWHESIGFWCESKTWYGSKIGRCWRGYKS